MKPPNTAPATQFSFEKVNPEVDMFPMVNEILSQIVSYAVVVWMRMASVGHV